MLDRTQPPLIQAIERLHLPAIPVETLDNGIPVYVVNMGTQDVVKIEIIFNAGRPYEHKQLVARATGAMLKEGVASLDSAAIAEHLDYYGSSLSTPANIDTTNIVLYSLNKYLPDVLPLVVRLLSEPLFPQRELDTFIQVNRQNLQVDLTKNDTIAYRTVTELIFGSAHPYGYNSYPDVYSALTRDDLRQHFERCYTADNCQIIISGKVEASALKLLNHTLGRAIPRGQRLDARPIIQPATTRQTLIPNPDTVQMAIRVGRHLFSRHHPDFAGMYVLNTILGGYFGSRLMENIREEKGYTYNIYSVMDTMRFDGCFYIATEVGNEFAAQTLQEIYTEMDLLRTEPVDEEELMMVHNYLMGSFLNMLDGPFNVSDVVRTLLSENLPLSYFENFVEEVAKVTSAQLQALAQRYLDPKDYYEVVVGAVDTLAK